jgi:alkylhydroperoxidase family enzyme
MGPKARSASRLDSVPRIQPVDPESASPNIREAYERAHQRFGRVTNMKATLLHSQPTYDALMTWYDLRKAVVPFLGERLADLFSHAISAGTDCLICSTYFRRALIDAGTNPDELKLDQREQAVIEFGQCLAQPLSRVPDDVYARLSALFSDEEIVALTAFGAMMVATNVVNNALEVDLDDYLAEYRKPSRQPTNKA